MTRLDDAWIDYLTVIPKPFARWVMRVWRRLRNPQPNEARP